MRPGKRGKVAVDSAPEGVPVDGGASADYRCLVRATDGTRKFSTAVRTRSGRHALSARADASTRLRLACQLTGKQIGRFLASYTILQKARTPRARAVAVLCAGKLTRLAPRDVTGSHGRAEEQTKREAR